MGNSHDANSSLCVDSIYYDKQWNVCRDRYFHAFRLFSRLSLFLCFGSFHRACLSFANGNEWYATSCFNSMWLICGMYNFFFIFWHVRNSCWSFRVVYIISIFCFSILFRLSFFLISSESIWLSFAVSILIYTLFSCKNFSHFIAMYSFVFRLPSRLWLEL